MTEGGKFVNGQRDTGGRSTPLPHTVAMPSGKRRDVTTDLMNLGKNLQSVTEDLGTASTEKEELTSEVLRTRRALDATRCVGGRFA